MTAPLLKIGTRGSKHLHPGDVRREGWRAEHTRIQDQHRHPRGPEPVADIADLRPLGVERSNQQDGHGSLLVTSMSVSVSENQRPFMLSTHPSTVFWAYSATRDAVVFAAPTTGTGNYVLCYSLSKHHRPPLACPEPDEKAHAAAAHANCG